MPFRTWIKREEEIIKIWSYLEDHGPQSMIKIIDELNISAPHIDEYMMNLHDIFESFQFFKGMRVNNVVPLYQEVYANLSYKDNGSIISLREDPRLIDYIANKINFTIVTTHEERMLRKYFENQIGADRTKEICKTKGYMQKVEQNRLEVEADKTAREKLLADESVLFRELKEAGYPDHEIKNIIVETSALLSKREISETPLIHNRKIPAYTINLDKEGIHKFLKPYQVEVMRYIWNRARVRSEGIISVEVYEYLQNLSNKKLHRSRASVIFFLDDMAEYGFLLKEWHTGKGGKRGVWRPSPDVPCEEAYMLKMAMRMIKVAKEIINTSPITIDNHARA